jgi:hypothetical protein
MEAKYSWICLLTTWKVTKHNLLYLKQNLWGLEFMKMELEFNTKLTDVPDILQKISQIVKSAKEQGFDITEVEIESDNKKEVNN